MCTEDGTPNRVLETLRQLKDEARRRYRIELKGVFGSHARGEAGEASDVDILVECAAGSTILDLAGLGNFLEEKLEREVDLVSEGALREEFRPYVLANLVDL
jgi:hypothetical protein